MWYILYERLWTIMKRMTKISILIFSVAAVLWHVTQTFASDISTRSEKIAYLKDGEVWTCDKKGRAIIQITKTGNKVDAFLFSPTQKYLAYSRVIKFVDEPGLYEDGKQIPQRALCSIVIMELESQKTVREIDPPDCSWIYPVKWLFNDTLLFYEGSGFDVSGFFEYDVQNNIKREVEYNRGGTLINADFIYESSVMLYVDDTGIGEAYRENLHRVDLRTKEDNILVSKRSILDPTLSHDEQKIAFFEVEYVNGTGVDNVWIYTIKENSLKKIYSEPASAKTAGTSLLSWSPDDRYIGKFSIPAAVIEVQDPRNRRTIAGSDINWTDDGNLIFSRDGNLYFYNLKKDKSGLIVKTVSDPIFLWKK